jgi:hypothetical protein
MTCDGALALPWLHSAGSCRQLDNADRFIPNLGAS